jgi:hypothetical protein
MMDRPLITPKTKVATLLRDFPELEEVLIAMAPPFKKLRNPILRRSVAKVASLRQAAAVGKIGMREMINALRREVGQEPYWDGLEEPGDSAYFGEEPAWFDAGRIVESIEEKELDPNVMPLNPLMRRASRMAEGEILELVSGFLPAPGIDILKKKGYGTWSVEEGELIRTYFCAMK